MEKILNDFYPKLEDPEQIDSLVQIFISHINQVLEICLNNEKEDINNEVYLEMSYTIIKYGIEDVNSSVKDKIFEFAKKYYNKYGTHSGICLPIVD